MKKSTTTPARSVSATKKSPSLAKASVEKKVSAVKKSAPKKATAKPAPTPKTVSKKPASKVVSAPTKSTSAPKTSSAKTIKKTQPVTKKAAPKSAPKKESTSAPLASSLTASETKKASATEGVKVLGILHIAGNILSGGTLGIVLVLIYLLVQKNELSQLEKETCYEIINFNLSFIIYTFISAILMFILIGFLLMPVVVVTWLVLMIIGFLDHLSGNNYKYPFVIRFIS